MHPAMPKYDFTSPRLFVEADLTAGVSVDLNRAQANYLINVLRLTSGHFLLVFNGKQGEWRARLEVAGRKKAFLVAVSQTRPQTAPCGEFPQPARVLWEALEPGTFKRLNAGD